MSKEQAGLELPTHVLQNQITEIPSLTGLLSALGNSPANSLHVAIFAPGATEPLFMVSVSRGPDAAGVYHAARSVGEGIIESRPAGKH